MPTEQLLKAKQDLERIGTAEFALFWELVDRDDISRSAADKIHQAMRLLTAVVKEV